MAAAEIRKPREVFCMEKQLTQSELNMRAKAYYDNHFNHVHHAHIDIAGDLIAGTLLSRIMWWFAPTSDGKSKLRVFKDGHWWLVKNREDWWDEIRITPKQYDRAIKVLEEKNLIIKKIYKFNGNPTTHIRLNFEQVEAEIEKWLDDIKKKIIKGEIDEKGRKSFSPKGKKPEISTPDAESTREETLEIPEEEQEESPKPLINLVFPQRGKTNSTEGEKRIQPKGENGFDQTGKSLTGNTDREYSQGKHTGRYTGDIDNNHHHHYKHQEKEQEKEVVMVVKKDGKKVIVPVKVRDISLAQEQIQTSFSVGLNQTKAAEVVAMCIIHDKDVFDVIENTRQYFLVTKKPIIDLKGALIHGAEHGWELPVRAKASSILEFGGQQNGFTPYDWVNGYHLGESGDPSEQS